MDKIRLYKLLAEVTRGIALIEKILEKPLEALLNDDEAVYALKYAVIQVVEAAAQIGLALVRGRGPLPESYGEVFEAMGQLGILSRETAQYMRRFAGLRNLLVHRYWEVDDARLYRELKEGGLPFLKRFAEEVGEYVNKVV